MRRLRYILFFGVLIFSASGYAQFLVEPTQKRTAADSIGFERMMKEHRQEDSVIRITDRFCGNSKFLSIDQIRKSKFFRRVKTIKVGSFGKDELLPSMPMKGNTPVLSEFREIALLSKAQEDKLLEILVNYDLTPELAKENKIFAAHAACYEPRNGIIFFDGREHIIAFIEICFQCQGSQSSPISPLGGFCKAKFLELKAVFVEAGIKYGTWE